MERTAPVWSTPGNVAADVAVATTPIRATSKRSHDGSHGEVAPVVINSNEILPQKRVRGDQANGILRAAWSTSRTYHKPVTGIPKQRINEEPKEAGSGAGRLATPDSQGVHHRSLLGPSLQQGWAAEAADGQMIWVEGSVGDVAHRTDSTVQHQEEAQQEYFEIPRNFRPEFRALLAATQDDWAYGTVRKIRCRLCPNIEFKKWGDFMRHCRRSETHPLKICFCNYCGDYFGRSDARRRHCNHRTAECLRAAPKKAYEKRRATQRAHEEYIERLGKGGTERFHQIIKGMFPDSSKRP